MTIKLLNVSDGCDALYLKLILLRFDIAIYDISLNWKLDAFCGETAVLLRRRQQS